MLRQRLLRHCRWCCYSRYVNAAVVATGMTYFRWHSGRGPRTTRPSHRLTRTSTSTTSSRRATWPNICTNWTRTTISTTSISDGKEQVRLWIPPTDIHLPVERTWHMGASFQCPVAHCKPVDNFYTLWGGFTEWLCPVASCSRHHVVASYSVQTKRKCYCSIFLTPYCISGEFINTKFFCRLCAMVHAVPDFRMWYTDISDWWHGNNVCMRPANGTTWATWRNAPKRTWRIVTGKSSVETYSQSFLVFAQ